MKLNKFFLLSCIVIAVCSIFLVKKFYKTEDVSCKNCNVIFIGVDTLRADHLSAYGYFRDTPHIDSFAKKSFLFKNAFSASSKTAPSFMSMMTSLFPMDHGINNINPDRMRTSYPVLNSSVKTLAQYLNEHGYKTQGIVTSNQLLSDFGFSRGFDGYEMGGVDKKRADLLDWIRENKNEKFFVFFHDYGPHAPYLPPPPYNSLYDPNYKGNIPDTFSQDYSPGNNASLKEDNTLEAIIDSSKEGREEDHEAYWSTFDQNDPREIHHLKAMYDGAIRYFDDFIGDLTELIEQEGLGENTIIILVSDHGEEFKEHGKLGHDQLYNELIHVPLIISAPHISKKNEIGRWVRTVDIMPTVFELLGISVPDMIRGKSLVPFMKDPEYARGAPSISIQEDTHKSIIIKDYKYLEQGEKMELYNIVTDDKEMKNLINEKSETARLMRNELYKQIENEEYIATPGMIHLKLDEKALEELRKMGYGDSQK